MDRWTSVDPYALLVHCATGIKDQRNITLVTVNCVLPDGLEHIDMRGSRRVSGSDDIERHYVVDPLVLMQWLVRFGYCRVFKGDDGEAEVVPVRNGLPFNRSAIGAKQTSGQPAPVGKRPKYRMDERKIPGVLHGVHAAPIHGPPILVERIGFQKVATYI